MNKKNARHKKDGIIILVAVISLMVFGLANWLNKNRIAPKAQENQKSQTMQETRGSGLVEMRMTPTFTNSNK